MTAPTPAVPDLLARLEQLRAAATPGPWWRDGTHVARGSRYTHDTSALAPTGSDADAALIVAAVNALPSLVSALRAVLGLCDEMDGTYLFPGLADTDAIRRRITAALDPAHDDERQDRG